MLSVYKAGVGGKRMRMEGVETRRSTNANEGMEKGKRRAVTKEKLAE